MTTTTYLLLGSNLGHRLNQIERAREELAANDNLTLIAQSEVYRSEAAEVACPQPDFLNQALKLNCQISEYELLDLCEKIEKDLGRREKGNQTARTIDIDLLLFGEKILNSERLILPHARLTSRPFALIPLIEIEPKLMHPETKISFADYLTRCEEAEVQPYRPEAFENVVS